MQGILNNKSKIPKIKRWSVKSSKTKIKIKNGSVTEKLLRIEYGVILRRTGSSVPALVSFKDRNR